MSEPSADPLKEKLAELVAKWRKEACGGNSEHEIGQDDALEQCADELEAALADHSAAPSERPVMGDGDYSCASCGMGMKGPCEHWRAVLGQDKPTRAGEPK